MSLRRYLCRCLIFSKGISNCSFDEYVDGVLIEIGYIPSYMLEEKKKENEDIFEDDRSQRMHKVRKKNKDDLTCLMELYDQMNNDCPQRAK